MPTPRAENVLANSPSQREGAGGGRRIPRSAAVSKPVFRPLTGFGPCGWALLPVAIALGACVAVGIDLRHELIRLIHYGFGFEGAVWFVARMLPGQSLALFDPIASPIMLLWILPALFIQPRRVPWWAWMAVPIAGVCFPNLLWEAYLQFARGSITGSAVVQAIAWFATCLWLPCACLWITTSRRCTVAVLLAPLALAGAAMQSTGFPPSLIPKQFLWFANNGRAAFHIVSACILIGGAIAARRRAAALRPYMCSTCGYDRRGLTATALCPECGSSQASDESSIAPAARAE
ncbi:MAG: hypothetical protein ACKVS8_04960 [Phycisphaerales bacterium]